MKSVQELYNERLTRIKKAIALEKPDRTPVVPYADAFLAIANGVKLSDYVSNPEISNKVQMDGVKFFGFDGSSGSYSNAQMMGMIFFSNLKLPGRELPDNMLWQIDEREFMTADDYDTIINRGFTEFQKNFYTTKINVDFEKVGKLIAKAPQFDRNVRDEGYPLYYAGAISHPVDYLSGGRTMSKFIMDLRRIPEKVEAVMDMITDANINTLKLGVQNAVDPISVFIAMGRGCPDFYHPKLWERFIWKPLKKITDAVIEMGVTANFHIDANWERALDYFKDFPKATCVFETDGTTDIYKIKEKLGDRMCIKGDVQAAKLTLGTPDEVYNYSTGLIKDMGTGFILGSGCGVPPNAKVENVKAMVAAATGK